MIEGTSGSATRRSFLAGSFALAAAPGISAASARAAPRIVSLDYGLATTLLALGVVPAGVAAAADWDLWVVEPELPRGIVDVGADQEPNLELLAAMRPDLILITPYLEASRSVLERIAPVLSFAIYADEGEPLRRAEAATLDLARRLGREDAAEAFLAAADDAFSGCARRLASRAIPPVALVNFMDDRHARIYGRQSLYQDVLERIGVANAWTGATNYWGFQTIGIEELGRLDPELRLISFEPVPPDTAPTLARSPLWTSLPFVQAGRVSTLPGVLMFGMVPSALRFGGLLTAHLESVSP
ncbi:ABC transporter substrate-binding protein [Faunimonas sp. B44]|uniref:ABC transporter substrate-binding protein n=1 Tax=Faunimonas sp. B44 TaxID=3461493 RepID=UPI004044C917